MDLLELHIIQSVPVNSLNRDDMNSPKTSVFGGVQRLRVSSQSWKRAIREFLKEDNAASEFFGGLRGKYWRTEVKKQLGSAFNDDLPENFEELVEVFLGFFGKVDKKNSEKLTTSIFFSPGELHVIAAEFVAKFKAGNNSLTMAEAKSLDKSITKLVRNAPVRDKCDIALFGRMLADGAGNSLSLNGAAGFNHILSTHEASPEFDFFAAVDETTQDLQVSGAAHVDTLEYGSGCFYRYIWLNLDLLFSESYLAHLSDAERSTVLSQFVRACLQAVPKARQNSMAAQTQPMKVLGLRRSGHQISLANAFEKPASPAYNKSLEEVSWDALQEHQAELFRTYELEAISAQLLGSTISEFVNTLLPAAGVAK